MRYVWKKVRQDKVGGIGVFSLRRVCGGAKGAFKLQRLRIGHETHVWKRGKRRDHTNLIFQKRGNADNEEVEVNYS